MAEQVNGPVGNRIFALQGDSVKASLTNFLKKDGDATTASSVAKNDLLAAHAKIKEQQQSLESQVLKSLKILDQAPTSGVEPDDQEMTNKANRQSTFDDLENAFNSLETANVISDPTDTTAQSLNDFIVLLRSKKNTFSNAEDKALCDEVENKIKALIRTNLWYDLADLSKKLPRPLTQEQSELIENPTNFGSAYQENQKKLNQAVKNYPAIADTFPDNSAQMNLARTTEKLGKAATELDAERDAAVTAMKAKVDALKIKLEENKTRLEKSIAAIEAEIKEKNDAIQNTNTPTNQIDELTKKKKALEALINAPKNDLERVKKIIPALDAALKAADDCKNPITCKPLLATCNKDIAFANGVAEKTKSTLNEEIQAAYTTVENSKGLFATLANSVSDAEKSTFMELAALTNKLDTALVELKTCRSKMVTPELTAHYANEYQEKLNNANKLYQDIAISTESQQNTLKTAFEKIDEGERHAASEYFKALQTLNAGAIKAGAQSKDNKAILNPANDGVLAKVGNYVLGAAIDSNSKCSMYHYVQNPVTREYEKKPVEFTDAGGKPLKDSNDNPVKPTLAALERALAKVNIERKAKGLEPLSLKISNKKSDGTFDYHFTDNSFMSRFIPNCGSEAAKNDVQAKVTDEVRSEHAAAAAKTATNAAALTTQNAPQAAGQANQPASTATFPGTGNRLGSKPTAPATTPAAAAAAAAAAAQTQPAVVPAVASGIPDRDKLAAAAEARQNAAPRSN